MSIPSDNRPVVRFFFLIVLTGNRPSVSYAPMPMHVGRPGAQRNEAWEFARTRGRVGHSFMGRQETTSKKNIRPNLGPRCHCRIVLHWSICEL